MLHRKSEVAGLKFTTPDPTSLHLFCFPKRFPRPGKITERCPAWCLPYKITVEINESSVSTATSEIDYRSYPSGKTIEEIHVH